jgi:ATP-dependent Clp protease ATP-binding subunit ClpA
MSEVGRRICQLAEDAARDDDPESALRTLTDLRRELDIFVREQVRLGLLNGRSFGELARSLGISRQAAHRRYRDLAPERSPDSRRQLVATERVRRAVRLAEAEARRSGVAAGSLHVMLAILHTDSEAARALHAEGVTLESARAWGRDGDGPDGGLRHILQQAGRVALARGDRELGLEGLLLAALADPDGGAGRTLAALGVTPAAVRRRLHG